MYDSFCSSLSLFILRFTFVELLKQKLKKKKKKKGGKIYRHKSMHVLRSTKPLTNRSWQVWRFIYNNHIDVKISPTKIWVHREQVMLVNVQGHLYEGTRQNTIMSIKFLDFLLFVFLDFWHRSKKRLIKNNNVKTFQTHANKQTQIFKSS